jgi:UDP-N-acetylmuramate dehydrogenase
VVTGAERPEPGALDAAVAALGPRCERDAPLGARTTYRVGGRAALLFQAATVDELSRAGQVAAALGVAVMVVGRGSNLLIADAGFPGLAVTLSPEAFGSISVGSDGVVRAGGAVPLPVLARQSAAEGLSGLEWAVGVPGSVGGAVRMNAGGHGAETRERLRSCRWVDLLTGETAHRRVDELEFGYRTSAVRPHHVVVDADFGLDPGDRGASEATIRDILRWRREHQPGGQNAGSVFANPGGDPPGNSAGWLVDAAGLKGLRRGSASVSLKHANFIQADPGGSADDVLALMLEVQQRVKEQLGVALRAEVRLIGFDQDSTSTLTVEGSQA